MALTDIQKRVLKVLATNRSDVSYLAGGLVLNRDWPRQSEDVDVFHDTDEDVGEAALSDIALLKGAGFRVTVDLQIYGIFEATVRDGGEATVLQWMSETRRRFFPLVRDAEWGVRLHDADLAVNKLIAASSRTKARDFVDLFAINRFYCRLEPLLFAAAGKPPFMAPSRMIEEIRHRMHALWSENFAAIRGLPPDWTPELVRDELLEVLDQASQVLLTAPVAIVGVLACDRSGRPQLVASEAGLAQVELRRAVDAGDIVPIPKDTGPSYLR